MDELVVEKLRAMGYKEVPKKLANMLCEFKKRQDMVRPAPLSLEAIVMCTMMYEALAAMSKKMSEGKKKPEDEQEGNG